MVVLELNTTFFTHKLRPRLDRGIEIMGKESQFFLMFGMQKKNKYFPEGRKNKGKIGLFPYLFFCFYCTNSTLITLLL